MASGEVAESAPVEEVGTDLNKDNILFVKNLNFSSSEKDIRGLANETDCSQIKSIKIVRNKEGLSQGYGFLEFQN